MCSCDTSFAVARPVYHWSSLEFRTLHLDYISKVEINTQFMTLIEMLWSLSPIGRTQIQAANHLASNHHNDCIIAHLNEQYWLLLPHTSSYFVITFFIRCLNFSLCAISPMDDAFRRNVKFTCGAEAAGLQPIRHRLNYCKFTAKSSVPSTSGYK